MNKAVDQRIQSYREDMIKHLAELVAIPSVKGAPLEGKPFGEEPYRALEYMLDLAEQLGFEVDNVEGYAGSAGVAAGEQTMGILTHLDVVPVGPGWSYPPFGGEIHDGRIYGRGASDNKGAAIASLYALKAVTDCGVALKDSVKVIFGCDEESGMECMHAYKRLRGMPDYGFSPDAEFPVIHAEKGIYNIALTGSWTPEAEGILSFEGGVRPNVVPDSGCCRVHCTDIEALAQAAKGFAREGFTLTVEPEAGDVVRISAAGKSAHAAAAQEGKNAIGYLAQFLKALGLGTGPQKAAIELLADCLGTDWDGKGMDVAFEDPVSGALTLNVGQLEMTEAGFRAILDIRYPVTADAEEILRRIQGAAQPYGAQASIASHTLPLYMPTDHPVLTALLQVYTEVTGEPGKCLSMGGGTYARTMRNGVAFGPGFPHMDSSGGVHQTDEYAVIDALVEAARVYAQSIVSLAGAGIVLPE